MMRRRRRSTGDETGPQTKAAEQVARALADLASPPGVTAIANFSEIALCHCLPSAPQTRVPFLSYPLVGICSYSAQIISKFALERRSLWFQIVFERHFILPASTEFLSEVTCISSFAANTLHNAYPFDVLHNAYPFDVAVNTNET